MADDPTTDSRTSLVGRKRDLQSTAEYEDTCDMGESSDDESLARSSKRVKRDDAQPEEIDRAEDDLVVSTISSIPAGVPGDGESSKPSGDLLDPPSNQLAAVDTSEANIEMSGIPSSDHPELFNTVLDKRDQLQVPVTGIDAVNVIEQIVPSAFDSHLDALKTDGHIEPTSDTPAQNPARFAEPLQAIDNVTPINNVSMDQPQASHDVEMEDQQHSPVMGLFNTSTSLGDLPAGVPSGWNKGVQSGLRISFGVKKKGTQAVPSMVPESTSFENFKSQASSASTRSSRRKQNAPEAAESSSESEVDSPANGSEQRDSVLSNHPDPSKVPFVKLSNKQRKLLSPDQKAVYQKQLAIFKKGEMKAATDEADHILALVGEWPLPQKYATITNQIAKGNTFYAKTPKEEKFFPSGEMRYKLPEVFNEAGLPIKVQDFSYNVFAPFFLSQNFGCTDSLRDGDLKAAFFRYCNVYYSKHRRFLDPVLESARAEDALSLDQVKARAKELSDRNKSAGTASANVADTFLKEIESQITVKPFGAFKETVGKNSQDSAQAHGQIGSSYTGQNQARVFADTGGMSSSSPVDGSDTVMSDRGPLANSIVKKSIEQFEARMQQKYFPTLGKENAIPRCLACGDSGHGSRECPALHCILCNENGTHSNFTCPNNPRCGKCRQRGHQIADCPEKLRLATSELNGCDICRSKDHLENACHFIWRSFAPREDEIRAVRDIPVYCYCCGESGHYGPECGLHRGTLLSGGYTWSKGNLMKYLDHASQVRTLSAGVDYTIPSKPKPKAEFSIKGKGRANDPFTIEDSDDEVEFIRPKINNSAPQNGHISFKDSSRPQASMLSDISNDVRHPRSHQNLDGRYARERSFSPPPRFAEEDYSFRFNMSSNSGPSHSYPTPNYPSQSYQPQAYGTAPPRGPRDAGPPPVIGNRPANHGSGGTGVGNVGNGPNHKKKKKKKKQNQQQQAANNPQPPSIPRRTRSMKKAANAAKQTKKGGAKQ